MGLVSNKSAQATQVATSNAILQVKRTLPVFRSTLQYAIYASGIAFCHQRLAVLAKPKKSEKCHIVGRVFKITGTHSTPNTQGGPQCLIVCGVAKLCVRVEVLPWLPRNRMSEFLTYGSVGGLISNGWFYPDKPLFVGWAIFSAHQIIHPKK